MTERGGGCSGGRERGDPSGASKLAALRRPHVGGGASRTEQEGPARGYRVPACVWTMQLVNHDQGPIKGLSLQSCACRRQSGAQVWGGAGSCLEPRTRGLYAWGQGARGGRVRRTLQLGTSRQEPIKGFLQLYRTERN